jgi:hypothetical protein
MRRPQLLVAGITALLLAALLGWQHHRERLVRTCIDGGGLWYGSRSTCVPHPTRPILRRALDRS